MKMLKKMTGRQILAGLGVLANLALVFVGVADSVSVKNGDASMDATFPSDEDE